MMLGMSPTAALSLPVKSVCLISGDGSDKLVITFELPSGVYPWTGNSHATMEVAKGDGLRYIVTHMWGVETTIVDASYYKAKPILDGDMRARIDWTRGCIVTDSGRAVPLPQPGGREPAEETREIGHKLTT